MNNDLNEQRGFVEVRNSFRSGQKCTLELIEISILRNNKSVKVAKSVVSFFRSSNGATPLTALIVQLQPADSLRRCRICHATIVVNVLFLLPTLKQKELN